MNGYIINMIARLSKSTGIPAWQFKIVADIPLKPCLASTAEEAFVEYFAAEENSEEQESALATCVELSTTVIQFKSAYEAGHGDSPAKKAALLKWKSRVLELTEMITTVTRAVKYSLSTPGCNTKQQKAKLARLKKKDLAAIARVNGSSTMEELLAAHKKAPVGMEARWLAVRRILELERASKNLRLAA